MLLHFQSVPCQLSSTSWINVVVNICATIIAIHTFTNWCTVSSCPAFTAISTQLQIQKKPIVFLISTSHFIFLQEFRSGESAQSHRRFTSTESLGLEDRTPCGNLAKCKLVKRQKNNSPPFFGFFDLHSVIDKVIKQKNLRSDETLYKLKMQRRINHNNNKSSGQVSVCCIFMKQLYLLIKIQE